MLEEAKREAEKRTFKEINVIVETCSLCEKKELSVSFFAASGSRFIVLYICHECLKLIRRGSVTNAQGKEIAQILGITSNLCWEEKGFSWNGKGLTLSRLSDEEEDSKLKSFERTQDA